MINTPAPIAPDQLKELRLKLETQ